MLRQGRLSPARARAIEALRGAWALPYSGRPIDFAEAFGRTAPVTLEIGFGMGDTTAEIAASCPETDFLAIDVHTPGVGSLLQQIDARQLRNVRIIQHDAVEVVRAMVPANSLARIHVFFPDPWPKKRHHKRRLVTPAFVHELAIRLAPGGTLHLATDWQDYAEQMLAVLAAEPLLENNTDDFAPRPESRPMTKFERRGLSLGHAVWDLLFRRRA